jgi:outer membrane immunogenic protein
MIGVSPTPKPDGALLGAQAGYNWQSGGFVYGAEADVSWTGMSDRASKEPARFDGVPIPGLKLTSKQEIDWLGTLRGRLGYAPTDQWLLYATGGLAWGHIKNSGAAEAAGFVKYPGADTSTKFGWVAGAGAEWAIAKRYSVKFEYLHYDLGHASDVGNPTPPNPPFQTKFRWSATGNLLRAGVNFRF